MLIRRNQEVSGNNYRDEPALDNNCNTVDFPDENNNIGPFTFKQKITGQTGYGGTKDAQKNYSSIEMV